MGNGARVQPGFFEKDALEIAPDMLRMRIFRQFDDGRLLGYDIVDVEVYRGEEDLACHASKGRTPRTEVMFHAGGKVYVYLVYGIYWLLNITTGPANYPQAILVRGTSQVYGPGRIGQALVLDKSFYGEDIYNSPRLWVEWGEEATRPNYHTRPRVGINYAGEKWAGIHWRFIKCL